MEKHIVMYSSGMSAWEPFTAVDYMIVNSAEWEHGLYAERPATDEENANYEELKADIIAQAEAEGIAPDSLSFWFDMTKQDAIAWMAAWAKAATDTINEKGELIIDPRTQEGQDFKKALIVLDEEDWANVVKAIEEGA